MQAACIQKRLCILTLIPRNVGSHLSHITFWPCMGTKINGNCKEPEMCTMLLWTNLGCTWLTNKTSSQWWQNSSTGRWDDPVWLSTFLQFARRFRGLECHGRPQTTHPIRGHLAQPSTIGKSKAQSLAMCFSLMWRLEGQHFGCNPTMSCRWTWPLTAIRWLDPAVLTSRQRTDFASISVWSSPFSFTDNRDLIYTKCTRQSWSWNWF